MEKSNKNTGDEALATAVFERVKPELLALKKEELLVINLDMPQTIATVLGVLPEVKALREQIAKELPSFDLAQFDKLEDYALALSDAQASYAAATQPPDDLDALTEDGTRLRATLLAEAEALVHRGLVGDAQLLQLKGANGYKNIAADLMTLTKVMQSVWSQIEGKTLTTTADLELAQRLSTRLLRVVGLREQGPARVAEATDLRQRAYTRLLLAYDDARRAVSYLRAPEGDADDIAPGLHPGRPRKRATEVESVTTAPVTVAPVPVAGAPVAQAPNATPAAAPTAASPGGSSTQPFVQ